MSGNRNDPRKAKLRRERIRKEKHSERTAPPPPSMPPIEHPFASERALRDIHALIEGQEFGDIDEVNTRLAELTRGGRLPQLAATRKQDDPNWRAQQLAYDALETEDPNEALRLAHEAQNLDPDCVDAQRLMVSILPMEDESRLRLMHEVVDKAEQNLGEEFFTKNMGHFWGAVETRPYMRAKQHLAELLVADGQLSEASIVLERLIELNPNDNQGMRFPLLGVYLALNQPESAARVLDQFPEDEQFMASSAWARVLERWLSGDLAQASAALVHARKRNPYAERYISGKAAMPSDLPSGYLPGDEFEARICAAEVVPARVAHPDFRKWLSTRSRPQR